MLNNIQWSCADEDEFDHSRVNQTPLVRGGIALPQAPPLHFWLTY